MLNWLNRCDWNEKERKEREEKLPDKYFFLARRGNYFVTLSEIDEIDTVFLMDHRYYYSVIVVPQRKNFVSTHRHRWVFFLSHQQVFLFFLHNERCMFGIKL